VGIHTIAARDVRLHQYCYARMHGKQLEDVCPGLVKDRLTSDAVMLMLSMWLSRTICGCQAERIWLKKHNSLLWLAWLNQGRFFIQRHATAKAADNAGLPCVLQ
jgi:hypothetical protein